MGGDSQKAPRRRGQKGADGGGTIRSAKRDRSASVEDLSYKPHKTVLVQLTEQTPTWYECGRHTPGRDETIYSSTDASTSVRKNSPDLVAQCQALAEQIWTHEVELFRTSESATTDERWVEGTMKRGTLKDRVASMSVVVSTSPVHKLYALDMLLGLAGVKRSSDRGSENSTNARVQQMAGEALADLFTNTLLPGNRKLLALDARPLHLYFPSGNSSETPQKSLSPRILLLWYYEHLLKARYTAFLTSYLARTLASSTELAMHKTFALKTACDLLKEVPEGETLLLGMVVNELGDPAKKVASAAGHHLRDVLEVHPNMVTVIAREVQQLAHRPHLSPRALYNCVIFLNQIKLNQATKSHDNSTIEEAGAGKKSTSTDNSLPASLINTYFRLFEIAVQPPALPKGKKKKKKDAKKGPSDKIDVGMKSRLLSALLTGVNRAHPFLPRNNPLMEKHIDALYKIVHTAPPGGCTQALMLLFNLAVGSGGDSKSSEKPKSDSKSDSVNEVSTGRKDRFYRALYSTLMTPTMLYSGKKHLTMYFNLIYKAMKYDTEPARIVAFGKRLLTSVMHCEASVIAGTLFLLSEVGKLQPVLANGLLKSRSGDEHTESDTPVWDPVKREPKRAFSSMDADKTNGVHEDKMVDLTGCIWEVSTLSQHYHPTVQTFSSNIGSISYNGDPLRDFTLVPFLNKFAYRNSKSMKRVEEQVQHGKVAGVRRSALGGKIEALSAPPVNDPKHWKNAQQSDADAFFLTFFKERARRDEINGVDRGKGAATSDDLLDATEKAVMADVNEDWEESDPEEEAFANALAEKLFEQGNDGKSNLDEEDPDMEGWSDFDDSEGDSADEEEAEDDEEDVDPHATNNSDSEESDVDFDDSDDEVQGNGDADADAFMDEDPSDSDDSDDEEEDQKSIKKKSEKVPDDSFADADEYAAIIEKGWRERDVVAKDQTSDQEPGQAKGKRTKRRKKN